MKNIVNPKLLFVFWTMVVIFMAVAVNGQFLAFKNNGEVKGITIAAVPIWIEIFNYVDTNGVPVGYRGQAPYTILFKAGNTGSNIASYKWDFGDSNADYPRYDQGRMVGHRFDNPGTYTVSLMVYDINGETGNTSIDITVDGEVGNTYYYISSSADGFGNGLSEGSPWTLTQLNNNKGTVSNGSKVLFKRGETFDFVDNNNILTLWDIKLLTRAYPYITIGAYGSGYNPVINTTRITTNDADENRGIILTNIEVTGSIWIRPRFHSSPKGFWTPGLQATLRNIKAKGIIIWESDGVVLENVVVNNKAIEGDSGSGTGILIEGHKTDVIGGNKTKTLEYIYVNKIEVSNAKGHCVYFAGGGNNVLIENNNFHDCGRYSGALPNANIRDGLTIHGNLDNVVVRKNSIHHNGYAFGFDSGYDAGNKYPDEFTVVPAELMTNFLFENNEVHDQVNYVSQIRSLQNSIFRNNIFYNNPNIIFGIYGPKVDSGPKDADTKNIEIYNNTFYNNRNTNYYYIGAYSNPTNPTPNYNENITGSIVIKNNIISSNTGSGNRVLIENLGSSAILQFSNNIYYNLGGGTQFVPLNSSYTLDTWLDSERDSGSYNIDPLFVSPAGYDFHLVDDISPAINAGASINNAYDYLGQLRTAVLDIGAYENLSAVPPCEEDWSSCTSWSDCISNTQTRTCTDSNHCDPLADERIETQTCFTTTPSCQENWSCSAWGACNNNTRMRTCADINNCNTFILKPAESIQCASIPSCEPSWGCTAWGACVGSSKSRSCSDSQNCGTADGLPVESASCAYCNP